MVFLIGAGLIGFGLYLFKVTTQAPDAFENPRHGLRAIAGILTVLGGLIVLGSLAEAGILK